MPGTVGQWSINPSNTCTEKWQKAKVVYQDPFFFQGRSEDMQNAKVENDKCTVYKACYTQYVHICMCM